MILILFYINLGISFSSKINKHTPMFIPESRVGLSWNYYCFPHRISLQTPCSTSLLYCQWQAVLSLVKIFWEGTKFQLQCHVLVLQKSGRKANGPNLGCPWFSWQLTVARARLSTTLTTRRRCSFKSRNHAYGGTMTLCERQKETGRERKTRFQSYDAEIMKIKFW